MPKRNDIKSILVIGAGPIVIGQACEFDYSGTQACKALRSEGYRIVLVNSNPATIMTDPDIADSTYIEPINDKVVENIIKKERPNAILPTMGGQTALNCVIDLDARNVLSNYNVEIIGASIQSIKKAEDRSIFKKLMHDIGLYTAKCGIAKNIFEARKVLEEIGGFPCIVRPSFTMGGSGSGIAYNNEEFEDICKYGLDLSPNSELLIDESLIGWKEFEMEVVRDKNDNCIIVCSIENFDPMGVHTGDSITVAPAQTLRDKEYQEMRTASIKVLKKIGVETGGSNVQFAINPKNGRMIVIEMNPRVSRSSALASKATGFPIAKIAAKLSVGYTLDELNNDITGSCNIPAAFEPAIDYCVTKIPRFNFEKFKGSNDRLTTQMKSVGEVMAIGRNFQESIQKAICSLEVGKSGFDSKFSKKDVKDIKKIKYELQNPGPDRLWYIGDGFRVGLSVSQIYDMSKIDKWFLMQIKEIIDLENLIKNMSIESIEKDFFMLLKSKGFSDTRISYILQTTEKKVRQKRKKLKIFPVFKKIDTCSGEFPTKTSYMYSTWGDECESNPSGSNKKVIIIGSGPNRIGQGIEFDYCCVHASIALKEDGYETILINCNPETVSTDYDISNKLYFEPVTLENILSIVRIEKPFGIIIQYGGQTPLKLAKSFREEGLPVIGTTSNSIDLAENRYLFQKIVEKLKLKQPKNSTVNTFQEAIIEAKKIGYPIMVRPSYVLGGRNMKILYSEKDLQNYFFKKKQSNFELKKLPLLLDEYLYNAVEVDVDAICDGEMVFIGGILEHIEQAGVHSGDSACSFPAHTLNKKIQKEIKDQVKKIAFELSVKGLVNVQFAIKNNEVYLLEVNPRASRSIPFLSKAIGIPLAKIAARVMCGITLRKQNVVKEVFPEYFSVKEVVLPFNKFSGVNPILGPEMRSTGEVMGIGASFAEAFSKAMLGAHINIKKNGRVLLSIGEIDKKFIYSIAKKLETSGFLLDSTIGTYNFLKRKGLKTRLVNKIFDSRPNVQDRIKNKEYVYIIYTAYSFESIRDSVLIYKSAIDNKVHFDSTINGSCATIMALQVKQFDSIRINKLQDLHKKL